MECPRTKFNGDRLKAYKAIWQSIQNYVLENSMDGIFEQIISVKGISITVRGKVIDGVVKIGTAFVK